MKNGEKIYESIASIGGRSMIASFPVDAALPARIADVCADTRAPHPVKRVIFEYLQPVILLGIVAFWWFAPKSVTGNPWVAGGAGTVVMIATILLEWVNERHAHWRLTVREFLEGAFYVVCNRYVFGAAAAIVIYAPLDAFVKRYGLSTDIATDLPFPLQVALLIVLFEFVQYWFHRMLHNHPALWEIHVPHHYITQMNTMNSAVGNWIEIMFLGLSLGVFFEMPLTAVLCAGNVGGAVAHFAHSNIRFDPPRWYSFFFTTIEHHSLHHSLVYDDTRCNYANVLIVLDRIFGTYADGEAIHVGQDNQRRLSIWEQTIWPFLPLVAKAKAKWR